MATLSVSRFFLAATLLGIRSPASPSGSDSAAIRRSQGYAEAKRGAEELRRTLRTRWMGISPASRRDVFLDTVSDLLARTLLERLAPAWFGTPWSVEGYSESPGSGTIACGYFVSTTLRDAGIRVNRFRLAQASPQREARSIAIAGKWVRWLEDSLGSGLPEVASRLPDGTYFVGLPNHVGYLRKTGSTIRFLHSDYVGGFVADQSVGDAPAFAGKSLWVARITGNRDLARVWLQGDRMDISP